MEDKKVIDFKEEAQKKHEEEIEEKKSSAMTEEELNSPVTRSELIDIISQITENMNQISDFLMKDVNTLYGQHVFPFQMQVSTLQDLLIEKGIIEEKDYNELYNKKVQDLQERARAVKEDDGEARLTTEEEDKEETNKKVLGALKNWEELDKRLEKEKK